MIYLRTCRFARFLHKSLAPAASDRDLRNPPLATDCMRVCLRMDLRRVRLFVHVNMGWYDKRRLHYGSDARGLCLADRRNFSR